MSINGRMRYHPLFSQNTESKIKWTLCKMNRTFHRNSNSSNSNLFCIHDTPMQYPTTLVEYVCKLKINRSSCNKEWNILHKIRRRKSYYNTCRLCNLLKIEIACTQGKNSLNKKSERTGKYKHYMKDFL